MENHQRSVPEKYGTMPVGLTLILIFTAFISWYIQHRWRNRRMYELISKMKNAPSNFIFGNVLEVLGTPTEKFNYALDQLSKYGPNFAMWFINIPVVMIGKPEDYETCMQSQSCLQKGFLYKFTKLAVGEGLFSAPVEKWRRNRKIIQPTFNSKILSSFVSIFASTSAICVNEILPKYVNKKDVDWFALFSSTHLDTISQTAMGVNTDAQRKQFIFGKYLDSVLRAVFVRMLTVYHYPDFIFRWTNLSKELQQSLKMMRIFSQEVLVQKKEEFRKKLENRKNEAPISDEAPARRKCFLELLLELNHQGHKFTDQELKDEVMTFFVGGTDTSATVTCFFLTMMGMHQDIQEKVYEEIITVFGPERLADVDDFAKLHLLDRCLKETMRLFSPAPFISREIIDKEVVLSDCTLPVGTVIIFSIFYTHRCADYWKDPLKFDPDRFLPEEVVKRHPYAFLPFSAGLRGCVGMRYSYLNLKNLLSMIIRKYKIHCDYYKSVEEIKLKNIIVIRPKEGFNFYLEERK